MHAQKHYPSAVCCLFSSLSLPLCRSFLSVRQCMFTSLRTHLSIKSKMFLYSSCFSFSYYFRLFFLYKKDEICRLCVGRWECMLEMCATREWDSCSDGERTRTERRRKKIAQVENEAKIKRKSTVESWEYKFVIERERPERGCNHASHHSACVCACACVSRVFAHFFWISLPSLRSRSRLFRKKIFFFR